MRLVDDDLIPQRGTRVNGRGRVDKDLNEGTIFTNMPMETTTHTPASTDDAEWQAVLDATIKDSLHAVDDAAKQLTSLSGLISGVYFGAVSLTKMSAGAAPMPNRALFLVPMALWLGTLLGAVLALAPRTPATDARTRAEAREASRRLVRTKHRWLMVSLGFFVVSLIALGAVLWAVLGAGA